MKVTQIHQSLTPYSSSLYTQWPTYKGMLLKCSREIVFVKYFTFLFLKSLYSIIVAYGAFSLKGSQSGILLLKQQTKTAEVHDIWTYEKQMLRNKTKSDYSKLCMVNQAQSIV